MTEQSAVGAFLCDDDPETWGARNRAPLVPEKWNRWVFIMNNVASHSEKAATEAFKTLFGKWFRVGTFTGKNYDAEGRNSLVDQIAILKVTTDLSEIEGTAAGLGWQRTATAADLQPPPTFRSQVANPIPLLPDAERTEGPRYWYALVEFVPRGARTDMAWPVFKSQFVNWRCPTDADAGLHAVYVPSERDVPPERDFGDAVTDALGKIAQGVVPGASWPFWITLSLAGLGALVVFRTVRGR